jgi:hypothetical protein
VQPVYQRSEFEIKELKPPAVEVSGVWHGAWVDPLRKKSEDVTFELRQKGNTVKGVAEFRDFNDTRADISGKISESTVSLLVTPLGGPYSLPLRSTWVGAVSNATVSGTWYLHGRPWPGYASSGPWAAEREEKK